MHYVLMTTTRGPFSTLLSEPEQILPAASPLTCLFPVSPLRDNVIYLREAQAQLLASIKDLKQRPGNVLPRALTKNQNPKASHLKIKDSEVSILKKIDPSLPTILDYSS